MSAHVIVLLLRENNHLLYGLRSYYLVPIAVAASVIPSVLRGVGDGSAVSREQLQVARAEIDGNGLQVAGVCIRLLARRAN